MCVRVSFISLTKKLFTIKVQIWFSTFVAHVNAIEKFYMKIQQIVCTQENIKLFEYTTAYEWNFFLMNLNTLAELRPLLAGAAPPTRYARQLPFVLCEY